jgi:hypothetical protein
MSRVTCTPSGSILFVQSGLGGGSLCQVPVYEKAAQPVAAANAGWASGFHSDIIGPAWLRSAQQRALNRMGADGFLAYYGLRWDVTDPEEISQLEKRSDPRIVAARDNGLKHWWGVTEDQGATLSVGRDGTG